MIGGSINFPARVGGSIHFPGRVGGSIHFRARDTLGENIKSLKVNVLQNN